MSVLPLVHWISASEKKGLTLLSAVALFEDTWFRFFARYSAVYCCHLLSLLIAYRHSSPTTYLLTFLISPRSRVLVQKLNFLRPSRYSHHFLKPQGSLPHSQVPAICPYPEPARSSPQPHIPLPEDTS